MNHSFSVEAAKKIGVEEAIIAETIRFWLIKNSSNQEGMHDGRYWTYNSASAWTEIYPYWSRRQIYRILHSLREKGIILVDQRGGTDRRMWISFTDLGSSMFRFGNMEVTERAHANTDPVTSHTVTNTVTEAVNVNDKSRAKSLEEIAEYVVSQGLTNRDAAWLWEKWSENNWTNGGKKIKDWRGVVRSWNHAGYFPSQRQSGIRTEQPPTEHHIRRGGKWVDRRYIGPNI
jgi:hypothetical protein